MCRREAGGEWSGVITLAARPDWSIMIHNAVYDRETDTVFLMARREPVKLNEFGDYTEEERREAAARAEKIAAEAGIQPGDFLLASTDDGRTFTERPFRVTPTVMEVDGEKREFVGFGHGSGAGIQLTQGRYAGRLLCPARFMTKHYTKIDALQECGFNNALYSDDHGETWHSSAPVQPGTGEGTLIERGDGTILYNSRAYFFDGRRYLAVSRDGGETFGEFSTDDFLREETRMGCNASMLRVGTEAGTLTLFTNPRADTRCRMTVCVSRDDGASWCREKLICEGPSGYSSLAFDGKYFCLLYENGENRYTDRGLSAAIFDTDWLMG